MNHRWWLMMYRSLWMNLMLLLSANQLLFLWVLHCIYIFTSIGLWRINLFCWRMWSMFCSETRMIESDSFAKNSFGWLPFFTIWSVTIHVSSYMSLWCKIDILVTWPILFFLFRCIHVGNTVRTQLLESLTLSMTSALSFVSIHSLSSQFSKMIQYRAYPCIIFFSQLFTG